ncbi:Tyrosine decarboxylase [Actinidia chinensis var. chinensis]|uniref:Tyrosine decarboxylase n=1 Tax=Actinidia chinensis var. chinensis TaxID=1590841 RepID=A0A2R6S2C0_ACTCC|nr:Tyrosine decarboxylase [Actinidia chinensis var. chinensis]
MNENGSSYMCLYSKMCTFFQRRSQSQSFLISRAVSTGEPLFNMNSGCLQASLDRVEAILTHKTSQGLVIKNHFY